MSQPLYSTTIKGGGMWSKIISRGKTLTLTDIEGGTNVSLLLYNADERQERYNMPDTLKGQHTFQLTTGHCLHSDMGRLFASITNDTSGWHDTVCGTTTSKTIEKKYQIRTYQDVRDDFTRNGQECFLIELAKWGLGKRDLVPNLNLFSKVTCDNEGKLTFDTAHAQAGASISLRFEMNTLVVLNTCPHPLDPSPDYAPKPVQLSVYTSNPVSTADTCIDSCPENGRAYQNTLDYNLLRF